MFAELVSRVLRNCHPEFHHPSLGATDLGACLPNAPVLVRSDFALRKHLFRAAVGSTVSIVPDTFKFREMRGAVGGPRQPIKPYVSVAQMSVLPIESWMSRASSGQMPMSALGKKLPTCGAKLNKNRDVCLSRDRAAGAGWKAVGL